MKLKHLFLIIFLVSLTRGICAQELRMEAHDFGDIYQIDIDVLNIEK
jgi:hypothetical protein